MNGIKKEKENILDNSIFTHVNIEFVDFLNFSVFMGVVRLFSLPIVTISPPKTPLTFRKESPVENLIHLI